MKKLHIRKLKNKLCQSPILRLPNFNLPFIVTIYASIDGLRAMLSQIEDNKEYAVAFASGTTNKFER